MSLRSIRLAAILLPSSLVLHEGAYALAGGGLLGGSHGYLELAVPLISALAASLALAGVLLPALGARAERAERLAPFALAAALVAIFCVQELAEAALFGGGWSGFAASVAVAWWVPPLALLLGALASGLVVSLERVGDLLVVAVSRRRGRRVPSAVDTCSLGPQPYLLARACSGLAFGFSRRPPPARA